MNEETYLQHRNSKFALGTPSADSLLASLQTDSTSYMVTALSLIDRDLGEAGVHIAPALSHESEPRRALWLSSVLQRLIRLALRS